MIIALIKFIVILLILAAVVVAGMYFTEPTSKFHAKVKLFVGLKLYEIDNWLDEMEKEDDDAGESQGDMPDTQLPEYDNTECNDKFGADFEYLSVSNSVSYGGDSPEVAYTNGFQAACKAAAQYRKQWNDAQVVEGEGEITSTVSENSQVYVDLIQGICTDAEVERISTTYPEINNIDEYIRGVKDACKSMTDITL